MCLQHDMVAACGKLAGMPAIAQHQHRHIDSALMEKAMQCERFMQQQAVSVMAKNEPMCV
jgi:hypothetical protein